MAVVSKSNSTETTSENITEKPCDEIDPQNRSSNTRELIKKAREVASQKFAQTINKPAASIEVSIENKIVLKGDEIVNRHGNLIKTKLKRPEINPIKAKAKELKSRATPVSTTPNQRGSKCLFEFYKEIRREYEDFREIEASRLKKRLEKLSDFPENSDSNNFAGTTEVIIFYFI